LITFAREPQILYNKLFKIQNTLRVPPAIDERLIIRLVTIENIANLVKYKASEKRGYQKKAIFIIT